MADPDLDDLERRMNGAVEALRKELGGLRTGRASLSLLKPIVVEAYETEMPLNQVATINIPEPRMLSVQVWDKTQVKAVEKAIRSSDLGLNPIVDGQSLRIPIPELNEERRHELAKVAAKYAEQAKVAVGYSSIRASKWGVFASFTALARLASSLMPHPSKIISIHGLTLLIVSISPHYQGEMPLAHIIDNAHVHFRTL